MKRVLLVEDHIAFAQAMKLVIGAKGDMEVAGVAHTLAKGREMIRNGETPDLVVVDLMLPDGNGVDLVAEIKGRNPDLPVVVLSAERDLSAALAAGADEAVNKDTPLPSIVSVLRRLA
jgi:DNA-binding NarL/FixJ family response regulator